MSKKYEFNVRTTDGLYKIVGERVTAENHPDNWFMLHRATDNVRKWVVTEAQSGLVLVKGFDKKPKPEYLRNMLNEIKHERLTQAIEQAIEKHGAANEELQEV